MPLLSIIIPVYNTGDKLKRCLNSIIEQKISNYEILLIDDSSNYKSKKIYKSFKKKYSQIKYFKNKKKLEVGGSRNIGIRKSQGKYLFFVDSDDVVVKNSLKNLINLLNENPRHQLIICKYLSDRYLNRGRNYIPNDFLFNSKKHKKNYNGSLLDFANDFKSIPPNCWRYIIKKNFLVKNKIFFLNLNCYEDGDFVTRLICKVKDFKFYNKPVYFYKYNKLSLSNSAIKKVNLKITLGCITIIENLTNFLLKSQLREKEKKYVIFKIKTYVDIFLSHLLLHSKKSDYRTACNKLKKIQYLLTKKFSSLKKILSQDFLTKIKYDKIRDIKKKALKNIMDSQMAVTSNKKVYIFGADLFGKLFAELLSNINVKIHGFLDNNFLLHGEKIFNLKVINPKNLQKQKDRNKIILFVPSIDFIFFKLIKKQFLNKGINSKQIIKIKKSIYV